MDFCETCYEHHATGGHCTFILFCFVSNIDNGSSAKLWSGGDTIPLGCEPVPQQSYTIIFMVVD